MDLLDQWHTWRVGLDPVLHDPLAIGVVFRPEFCSFAEGRVDVETTGSYTRGMTRFSPADALPKRSPARTKVARTVNAAAFVDLFLQRVAAPPRARK
jgi:inosine-uridine nucleoside N-ribohydrolase